MAAAQKHSFRDPNTNVLTAWGFVTTNAPGEIAQVEADSFALAPGLWQWNGSAWVPYTPPAQADGRGFELALHDVFSGADQATLNTLAGTFPLFLWALKVDQNWPAVEQIVKAALQATIITQNQYNAIKTAATANHIPVSL